MIKISAIRPSVGHSGLNLFLYFRNKKSRVRLLLFYSKKENHNLAAFYYAVSFFAKQHRIFLINSQLMNGLFCFLLNRISIIEKCSFIANVYNAHKSDALLRYGSNLQVWYPGMVYPKITPIEAHQKAFATWRKTVGLGERFILVSCRDPSFYGEERCGIDSRNCTFMNLIPAIRFLLSEGFDVVRVGRSHVQDGAEKILNSKRFYDVDLLPNYGSSLDCMLFANCFAYVGSNSGIGMLGYLFDCRFLIHNSFPIGLSPIYNKCKFILKKYKDVDTGKLLRFCEIPDQLKLVEDGKTLHDHGLDVVENGASEIAEFVRQNLYSEFCDQSSEKLDNYRVYGGNSSICKDWMEKNSELFF